MNIEVPDLDARASKGGFDVIDADTGMIVGLLECGLGKTGPAPDYFRRPSRLIELFDGKYRGYFETHSECQAFAKGVEAVLNHLTSQDEVRFVQPEPDVTTITRRI